MKRISLNTPIAKIIEQYPDVIEIMRECGFIQIVNPMMLKTVGKIMSIKQGASIRNIELKTIIEIFKKYGYEMEA